MRSGVTAQARHSLLVAGAYLLCHAVLFAYDLHHPDAILAGDRATDRTTAIGSLLAGPGFLGPLARNGAVGDYIAQAALFAAGGRIGILAGQIALGLAGALFCLAFARRTLNSESAALAAALTYIVLPGSLITPHVLVSEAIANPLLVMGVAWLCAYLDNDDGSSRGLYAAALVLGVAALVRPQYLLLPLCLVPAALAAKAPKIGVASAALAAALFIAPAATGAATVATAQAVDHSWQQAAPHARNDIAYHLWSRAGRMSAMAHFALPENAARTQTLAPGAFAAIALQHPSSFAWTLGSDTVNLAANPGTNQLLVQYLQRFRTNRDLTYWLNIRDREGMLAMLRDIAGSEPGFAASFFASAALWALFLAIAALGAIALSHREARADPRWRFVTAFTLYALAVPFAAGAVRWSHRTPIDFVLATLFAAGLLWVAQRGARK